MFDLRYHVASLAAVFFALVIGILVGVALASHGLRNTERDRLERDLRIAENRADGLQAQLNALEESGALDRAFVDRTYKLVLADRLKGRKIAVLFYNTLRYGSAYVDPGIDYYEERFRRRTLDNLRRRADALGFKLVEASSVAEGVS